VAVLDDFLCLGSEAHPLEHRDSGDAAETHIPELHLSSEPLNGQSIQRVLYLGLHAQDLKHPLRPRERRLQTVVEFEVPQRLTGIQGRGIKEGM